MTWQVKRCWHGRDKHGCAECKPCPHGKLKHHCAECKPCPHGTVKGDCVQCVGCPHGKMKKNCKECKSPPRCCAKSDTSKGRAVQPPRLRRLRRRRLGTVVKMKSIHKSHHTPSHGGGILFAPTDSSSRSRRIPLNLKSPLSPS